MIKYFTKYIWFSYDGCGFSVAEKLKNEGNEVMVAQVENVDELDIDIDEKPENKKLRLQTFDGILEKKTAKEMIRFMSKIENKDEWFVVFDFNNLWKYSEMALKLGFKNGFFPLKKDWEFEEDRNDSKEFVKKYYQNLNVAEVNDYKSIDDAIKFLEDTEEIWVLKSYNPDGSTVVPFSTRIDEAREEIIGALKLEKSDYESNGFILERKIINPIEITPAAVFYDGRLIFTDIDIENKPIGGGSLGNMTGCSSNLIFKTEIEEKINRIAFPQIIYDMAKERKGMFVWDCSILIDPETNQLYFGEFCSNRWGWDSFFTELAMSSSVSDYFNGIVQGRNPLVKDFGVGVRMFNLKQHIDVPIIASEKTRIFIYDGKKKDDHIVSVGNSWDLLVATGADNDLQKALRKAYKLIDSIQFSNKYYRTMEDFLSTGYQNSIMNRFNFANGDLYDIDYGINNILQIEEDERLEKKVKRIIDKELYEEKN